MKKLQPYVPPLVAFVTTLTGLGYRVIRQIILPTRRRKGNLLSSLFVLFTSLSEHVIGFAETIARIPGKFHTPAAFDRAWVYSRRHLRRVMLVAVWALFILSSLEWTSPQQTLTPSPANTNPIGAASPATIGQQATLSAVIPDRQTTRAADKLSTPITSPPRQPTTLLPTGPPSTFIPRWLLLCTLRR